MEVMRRAGLAEKLSRLLSPALRRLFPDADQPTMNALSANVSANLLGLGNAATPMGLLAAKGFATAAKGLAPAAKGFTGGPNRASHSFILLVVINTASLQLIPVTIATVRAANGAAAPFDILPHVWVSSAASMTAAIVSARLSARAARAKGAPL
ncbi:MAG: spore maturation protein A, partial [Oscillospiraceae bacterium]|nr:spore maturation protein A [Oscillospiraceae bacterium]